MVGLVGGWLLNVPSNNNEDEYDDDDDGYNYEVVVV